MRTVGTDGSAGVVLCTSRCRDRRRRRRLTRQASPARSSGCRQVSRRFLPCSEASKSVRVGTRPWTSTRIVAPAGAPVTRSRITKSASGSTTGRLADRARACRCAWSARRDAGVGRARRRESQQHHTEARDRAQRGRSSRRVTPARRAARRGRPVGDGSRVARRARARPVLRSCVLTIARDAPRRFIQRSPSSTSARATTPAPRRRIDGQPLEEAA